MAGKKSIHEFEEKYLRMLDAVPARAGEPKQRGGITIEQGIDMLEKLATDYHPTGIITAEVLAMDLESNR